MNFDGLTLKLLVKELKNKCINSQVQKILQLDKHTLIFRLFNFNDTFDLVITMGRRPGCYISTPLQDLPKEPSSLCMYLRKHLEGSRVTNIEEIHDDRIIKITLDKLALNSSIETKHMYIELMGKYSNCIIVENNMILESLIHVTPLMSQAREIQPKVEYKLPPNANRMCIGDFDAATITKMLVLRGNEPLSQTLRTLFNGIGTPFLKEISFLTNIDLKTPLQNYTEEKLHNISTTLIELYKKNTNSLLLYDYISDNNKHIYSAIPLTYLGKVPHIHSSISEVIKKDIDDHGSIGTTKQDLMLVVKNAILKEKKRYAKIQEEYEETLNLDVFKTYGDLLMIYAYLPHTHEKSITLINCLSDEQKEIEIPLHPELTLVQNGQAYYKKYNRLKNRLLYSEEQLKGSKNKTNYLESILYSLEETTTKEALEEIKSECQSFGLIKKTPRHMQPLTKKASPLIITIPEGRIIIGLNNKQNDYITHTLAKSNDIWFHTQKIHGAHVILQSEYEPSQELLLKVASYAAYYSKSKHSINVPVDYTYIKFIKKAPHTPLGFVIYKNQRTLYVTPEKPPINKIG